MLVMCAFFGLEISHCKLYIFFSNPLPFYSFCSVYEFTSNISTCLYLIVKKKTIYYFYCCCNDHDKLLVQVPKLLHIEHLNYISHLYHIFSLVSVIPLSSVHSRNIYKFIVSLKQHIICFNLFLICWMQQIHILMKFRVVRVEYWLYKNTYTKERRRLCLMILCAGEVMPSAGPH